MFEQRVNSDVLTVSTVNSQDQVTQKPLRDSVKQALKNYFAQLNGQDVNDLYELVLAEVEQPLLDMVMRVARRSVEEQNSPGDLLNSDDKVGKFLVGKFFGMTNEALYLLCLDNACRLISCTLLSEGSSSIARLELRKVIGTALQCNAPTVILAHNHPGGRAYPSDEDIRATTRLQGILRLMDINLVDHFIVAGEKWKSMARMGELSVTRTTIL